MQKWALTVCITFSDTEGLPLQVEFSTVLWELKFATDLKIAVQTGGDCDLGNEKRLQTVSKDYSKKYHRTHCTFFNSGSQVIHTFVTESVEEMSWAPYKRPTREKLKNMNLSFMRRFHENHKEFKCKPKRKFDSYFITTLYICRIYCIIWGVVRLDKDQNNE